MIATRSISPTLHFNSIKVRLERVILRVILGVILFQFHKGTIRTAKCKDMTEEELHFNSIKVRLERNNVQAVLPMSVTFQFHKGTIRTSGISGLIGTITLISIP